MKKTIAIIILIIGLLLVLSPFIKSGIVKYLSERDSVTNYSAETIEKNNNRDANFDFASVELPSMTSVVKGATDYDKNAVVGSIAIPSVDLNLMVLKGTNTANLLAGATTMREDQVMGKGNYPLAGHHMRNGSMLFGPVMNVKEGAKIYLTDLTNLYTYEVTNTKIVKDTEVGVIDDTTEPQITLVTCDVATETDQRFIATGKLVSTEKLTKEAKQKYFE